MNTQRNEVLWLENPFDLAAVTRYPVENPQTIRQWIDEHGGEARLNRLPTVCVCNGHELTRAEYDQPLEGLVWFVTLPTGGGGGSNPLAAIATLALAIVAPYAVGAMGFTTAAGTLTLTGTLLAGGIILAGSMLINAVFPPPELPGQAIPSTGSPTYSIQAQGNLARLGSPIPVNYGRMRIYPDFAAQPYTEFEGNQQFLYQLFCIGQGENTVSDIRLEHTPIGSFADVSTEIIPPLGTVTLFHTAVVNAATAGGQDMNSNITQGPYVINDAGSSISRIAVDIVFPGGLIGVNRDNGDEYAVSVSFTVTAEPLDDSGVVTGSAITLFTGNISGGTRTAIRRTIAADVTPGRYQVTVSRNSGAGSSTETKNATLGAVRGFLVDDNQYGDVTLLAVRVRATANISNAAARKLNVLVERKIPVWDSTSGWSQPQLTRNPAWAFADAVRARYGGDFADEQIDLNGLHYLAGVFDSRGDKFDGRFDTEQSLWDALTKIGQVCRSGPIRQGNLIRLIRDQHQDTPSQMFSMANISDFSADFIMHNDRTADAVNVTYWDADRDFSQTTILCQLPGETANNPQTVTLFGCTQYEQAWREGMYLAASNRERRQLVSFTTGLEGHIPAFGSVVLVNHDLFGDGQAFSGIIEKAVGDRLTLSNDVELPGLNWYIILRNRHGEPSAPIAIESVSPNQVKALDPLPVIESDIEREPTHYMIGQGSAVSWPVKVTGIVPEGTDRVMISGCIESDFVHSADQGIVPAPPPPISTTPPSLTVTDLRVTQGGTLTAPVIFLSWAAATGADRYFIEYSDDGRTTWQPAGDGQALLNQHEFTVSPGLITCRVAAVGAIRGDWTTVDVNAGSSFDTPGPVILSLVEPFTGNALKVKWDAVAAAARYSVDVEYSGQIVRSLYLERGIHEYHYHYSDAQDDAAGRTLTVNVNAENAEGVSGTAGTLTATNPAPAIPDNITATGLLNTILVSCDQNADPDIRELRIYGANTSGFTPSPANLIHRSDNALTSVPVPVDSQWWLKLVWVDNWGPDTLNFSSEVQAEARKILETEIGPDSISTPMLKANAVTADKIAAGSITGTEISSATTITAGTGINTAGMNGATDLANPDIDNIRFWAGSSIFDVATAPFRVNADGSLYTVGAEVSGVVNVTGTLTSSVINTSQFNGGVINGAIIVSSGSYVTNSYDTGSGTRFFYIPNEIIVGGAAPGNRTRFNVASAGYTQGGTDTASFGGNTVTYYLPLSRMFDNTVIFDGDAVTRNWDIYLEHYQSLTSSVLQVLDSSGTVIYQVAGIVNATRLSDVGDSNGIIRFSFQAVDRTISYTSQSSYLEALIRIDTSHWYAGVWRSETRFFPSSYIEAGYSITT